MMRKKIEFDEKCQACNGTGLYVGICERDGSAVVCRKCNGTGKYHFVHEYEEFKKREICENVEHVVEINPGICIGRGKNGEFLLSDFGGMPYCEWLKGLPFPKKSENRKFTCPAHWYQLKDYKQYGSYKSENCKTSHKKLIFKDKSEEPFWKVLKYIDWFVKNCTDKYDLIGMYFYAKDKLKDAEFNRRTFSYLP